MKKKDVFTEVFNSQVEIAKRRLDVLGVRKFTPIRRTGNEKTVMYRPTAVMKTNAEKLMPVNSEAVFIDRNGNSMPCKVLGYNNKSCRVSIKVGELVKTVGQEKIHPITAEAVLA